jgi:hypothetical protein
MGEGVGKNDGPNRFYNGILAIKKYFLSPMGGRRGFEI